MNFTSVFIRRPVFTTVLMAALVMFGTAAFFKLPVNELPNVDFPTITVRVTLSGASPETMSTSVATPLEQAFSAIAGIDSMSSESSTGSTQVVLQFDLDRSIDGAAQDVQAALSQARGLLPSGIDPPEIRKTNPSDAPVMHLAITSRTIALPELNRFAKERVALRMATVKGVGQVDVNGAQRYAVRIYVDPRALAARKLGFETVVAALQSANSNSPAGTLDGSARSYTVVADGQLHDAASFNRTVVAYQNGQPVRLEDIGKAEDSVENIKTSAFVNGQRAIEVNLHRQPGANTVEVTKAAQKILADVRQALPGDAELRVLYDRGDYIEASIHDVELTLVISLVLVVLVIMLFLRNLSATLIVATVLPTSMLGTFAVMQLLGYSLDNVSLLALTLSVGFVVDDAIVVLENIVRHIEMGKSRLDAALDGAKEIGFTVASITLSLGAVFLPIVFMGGIVGRLFSEFGVTMMVAVLLSGFISLSLTPMLAGRFLTTKTSGFVVFRWFEAAFQRTERGYERALVWCIDRTVLLAVVSLAVLGGTVFLYTLVDKGFIPKVDSGKIDANTRVAEGTPYADFVAAQNRAVEIVRSDPNVAAVMSVIGSDGTLSNTGRLLIGLKPLDDRTGTADDVIQNVRRQTAKIQGLEFTMRNPPAIDIGPQASNAGVQYVLQSTDATALRSTSEAMLQTLSALPQVQDPNTDLQLRNPEIHLAMRREQASLLGITPSRIQDTLSSAYGGRRIGYIYGSTDQYPVILQVARRDQADINALDSIHFASSTGDMVPLRTVADVSPGVGPVAIHHYDGLPSVTLSFNQAPGVSLGEATDAVRAQATKLDPKVTGRFSGAAEAFQASLRDLPMLLLVTVVLIYMIMAVLYEHFLHPITILTALPLAGFGALLMLLVFGEELNLFSFVGFILLVGLVKKNGIMMVDFALDLMKGGDEAFHTPREAMVRASVVRFRPIMMTTLAAILGSLPIALGIGAGAEARRPLGIAVVGGLVFSQLLTLFITPAFFVAMERWFGGREKPAAEPAPVRA